MDPKTTLNQEFAFTASESGLICSATNGNLLAVAGHEEVVKLFNLQTKKSAGELGGVHTGSVTCLAATSGHVLSGSMDGEIVIWRT
jgi:WD40 repeat protein